MQILIKQKQMKSHIRLESRKMKKDVSRVWKPFLEVHSIVSRKLEKELLAEFEIGLSVYDVLIQLRLAGGELELTELARRLLISNSGVTRLLDRMEKKNLVKRARSTTDRRKVSAVLTKSGRDLEKRASRVHVKGIESHFLSCLDAENKAALAGALQKVLTHNEEN